MQTQRGKAPCLTAKPWQWHPPAKSARRVHANSAGKRLPVRLRSRGNDTRQQRERGVSMQTRREKAPCLIAKLWQ